MTAEVVQQQQWMDSWLQYVRSSLPADSPFRLQVCEEAEQLLRELDRGHQYNSIVRKALDELMERNAVGDRFASFPVSSS